MSEKLQKVLARVGLGSRRYMEEVIAAGRITVNGVVAEIGQRIEQGDELRIDGRKINYQIEDEIRRRVIIYYKPEGEICSRSDPENRPTVFDHLPQIPNDRWVMVGRLDINSTGLLLFTNDGELANRLMHPSNEVEREYAVRVMGEVTPEIRQTLLNGVELEDGPAKFESFSELGGDGINRWYQVVVKEGRNREVRRLFESQGLKVSRLLRTRYGSVILPRELRTGRWVELDKHDIHKLTDLVALKPRQGTGLYGMAKRRTEKMFENPMPARREFRNREDSYQRKEQRNNDFRQPQQYGANPYQTEFRQPYQNNEKSSFQPRQNRSLNRENSYYDNNRDDDNRGNRYPNFDEKLSYQRQSQGFQPRQNRFNDNQNQRYDNNRYDKPRQKSFDNRSNFNRDHFNGNKFNQNNFNGNGFNRDNGYRNDDNRGNRYDNQNRDGSGYNNRNNTGRNPYRKNNQNQSQNFGQGFDNQRKNFRSPFNRNNRYNDE